MRKSFTDARKEAEMINLFTVYLGCTLIEIAIGVLLRQILLYTSATYREMSGCSLGLIRGEKLALKILNKKCGNLDSVRLGCSVIQLNRRQYEFTLRNGTDLYSVHLSFYGHLLLLEKRTG